MSGAQFGNLPKHVQSTPKSPTQIVPLTSGAASMTDSLLTYLATGVTVVNDAQGRPVVFVSVDKMFVGKITNIMEATPGDIPSAIKVSAAARKQAHWEMQKPSRRGSKLPLSGRAFTGRGKHNTEMGDFVKVETSPKASSCSY